MSRTWTPLLLLASFLLLLSCGDVPPRSGNPDEGADDTTDATASTPTTNFGGGVGGSGNGPVSIYYGSITDTDNFQVNDLDFDVTGSVYIDGEAAEASDLKTGMVVGIEATIHEGEPRGTADLVVFESLLHGPIANVPVEDQTSLTKDFTVLGVTVRIEPGGVTQFWSDGTEFGYGTVAQGDVVAISGFFDQNGVLRASYAQKTGEYVDGPLEVRVSGEVSGLDPTGEFLLRDLPVTFDPDGTATDFSAITGNAVTEGLDVLVSGVFDGGPGIFATAIEPALSHVGQDGSYSSLEGIVSDYQSVASFRVDGQLVDASSAVFVPQSYSDQLHDGQRVLVEGQMSDGTLLAEKVTKRSGKIRVWAPLSILDLSAGTLALSVLPDQPDVEVTITDKTHVVDSVAQGGLEDFLAGDFIVIKALLDDDGGWTATHVMRKKPKNVRLMAGLESVDAEARTLTMLGLTFTVNEGTNFEDGNGEAIDESVFFEQATPGTLLNAWFEEPLDEVADRVALDEE